MRFWQLFLRSLKETYRDPLALGFLLAFPLLFMLVMGAAFSGGGNPSYTVGVIDKDQTQVSQAFINEALTKIPILKIANYDDTSAALENLRLGDIRSFIVIPDGFGDQVTQNLQGKKADITLDITYDESDMSVSQAIISSVDAATRAFAKIEIPVTINASPINIKNKVNNMDFFAPGIIIFGLLIMIPTSARTMVRDKGNGFLARMLTTPTKPWEFIISYSVCLTIIAAIQIVFFIIMGLLFGMHIVGNIWLAFLIFMLTAICSIGIGMVVAALTKTENQAEPLTWLFSMPLAMISGAWFSISFMPRYLQDFAHAFPFSHAVEAARTVITRGAGLEAVQGDIIFLSAWAVGVIILGIILFGRTMRS